MMQDSAGAVIGALLGAGCCNTTFAPVCATGAVLFVLCAAFMRGCYRHGNSPPYARPFAKGATRVMRDKRFVTYVLTLAGYYMLAVQVMLMLPIMVNDVAGAPSAVKWMYAIGSVSVVNVALPYRPLE